MEKLNERPNLDRVKIIEKDKTRETLTAPLSHSSKTKGEHPKQTKSQPCHLVGECINALPDSVSSSEKHRHSQYGYYLLCQAENSAG